MPKAPRAILPAPNYSGAVPYGAAGDLSPVKRRARAACEECRAKKVTCDGKQPACTRCSVQEKPCRYNKRQGHHELQRAVDAQLADLQERLKQHEDVLCYLRSIPDTTALSVIRRLRATPDAVDVLTSIRSGMLRTRPSDLRTASAVLPDIQSHLEIELIAQHGNMYLVLAPLDAAMLEPSNVFQRSRSPSPRRVSTLSTIQTYEHSIESPGGSVSVSPDVLIAVPPSPLRSIPAGRATPVEGPLQDRIYCDPRLNRLDIGYWTRVPVSDDFAASLISVYLENEHGMVNTFDAETFLDDLVACRLNFCSSFLVSSILCIACQCYTGLDSRAFPLSIAFLNEAEKLWHAARSTDSLVNLAATNTLCIATMLHGKESLSLQMLTDSRQMAERMYLLGIPHTIELVGRFRQLPTKELRTAANVAWGCYCMISLHASYYSEEPIRFPPVLPIPADNDTNNPFDWPILEHPGYLGRTIAPWCKFWTIVEEIQMIYHRRDGLPLQDIVSCAFAEEKYHKLSVSADHLTEDMHRKGSSPSHVLVFHAFYHIAVLDLFRPFLASDTLRLRSFTSSDNSPKEVFHASLRQLQRLFVEYCKSYDTKLYNFLFNAAALHIAHRALHDAAGLEFWYYLMLCLGWMKEAFVRYPIIGKAAQAYLTIGMAKGKVTGAEALSMLEDLQQRSRHHNLTDITASFVVDFDVAMSSTSEGRAQSVAQQFDELALLDQLVTGEYDIETLGSSD